MSPPTPEDIQKHHKANQNKPFPAHSPHKINRTNIQTVSQTTMAKITIRIDEERLKRMKRTAKNLYGDAGSLDELMVDAAESFDAESILEAFTKKIGWEAIEYPSLTEIEERRPTSIEAPAETKRKTMRGRKEHEPRQ